MNISAVDALSFKTITALENANLNELINNGIYQYTNNNNVTNRPDNGYWGTLLSFKTHNYNNNVTMQMSLSYSGNIYTRSKTDNENFEIWKMHDGIISNKINMNGYIKYVSGFTIQWGAEYNIPSTSTSRAVGFPIEYSAICYTVYSQNIGWNTDQYFRYLNVQATTKIGFTVYPNMTWNATNGGNGFFWMSIGY